MTAPKHHPVRVTAEIGVLAVLCTLTFVVLFGVLRQLLGFTVAGAAVVMIPTICLTVGAVIYGYRTYWERKYGELVRQGTEPLHRTLWVLGCSLLLLATASLAIVAVWLKNFAVAALLGLLAAGLSLRLMRDVNKLLVVCSGEGATAGEQRLERFQRRFQIAALLIAGALPVLFAAWFMILRDWQVAVLFAILAMVSVPWSLSRAQRRIRS